MNIILFLIEIIISSLSLIYLYKKYKQDGIYLWITLFSILIGILSQKVIDLFNLKINLGIAISVLIFISSNILIQKKGPKEIKKVLTTIIITNVAIYSLSVISTIFVESNINEITNIAFDKLFYLNNRVYFATIISLLISLWLNAMLYHQIRQIKNKIVISNILSMIIIQFIECVLFCAISYIVTIPLINVIELIVIRYIFKVTLGILGTSIMYITNKFER